MPNTLLSNTLIFNDHVAEYEEWFEKYPFVFQSEVEALRELIPKDEHLYAIEIGLATGRFSEALGIKEGIEPSENMRKLAAERGIEVMDGIAEMLPYKDNKFDLVLIVSCITYFDDLESG